MKIFLHCNNKNPNHRHIVTIAVCLCKKNACYILSRFCHCHLNGMLFMVTSYDMVLLCLCQIIFITCYYYEVPYYSYDMLVVRLCHVIIIKTSTPSGKKLTTLFKKPQHLYTIRAE